MVILKWGKKEICLCPANLTIQVFSTSGIHTYVFSTDFYQNFWIWFFFLIFSLISYENFARLILYFRKCHFVFCRILINYVASLIDSTGEDIFYNTYNKKPYVTKVGLEKGLDILNIALLNMKVNEISEFYFYNLNYLNNLKKFEFEKNTKFKFKIEVIKLIKRNSNKIKFKFVKII